MTLKAGHSIVRSGPYAITRHPIYTGMLGAILTTALARNSIAALIGFVLILAGLYLKLQHEEQFLRARFGSAYDEYTREVPSLVPRLR